MTALWLILIGDVSMLAIGLIVGLIVGSVRADRVAASRERMRARCR